MSKNEQYFFGLSNKITHLRGLQCLLSLLSSSAFVFHVTYVLFEEDSEKINSNLNHETDVFS